MNRAAGPPRWQECGSFSDLAEPALTVVKKTANRKLFIGICTLGAG
jgi:hypothetical protein